MKVLILLLSISLAVDGFIEETFDFGEGETLTMRMEDEDDGLRDGEEDYPTSSEEADEDEEVPYIPDDDTYDPEKVDDILVHDCGNIRDFQADYAKNDLTNPLWKLVANGREPKRYRKLPQIKKYNHAYGIPVFGVAHFKDESMKRACYLIRYLFADNEGFRRMAYKKKMYAYGERGGFMTGQAGNIGNPGQSCPCSMSASFPVRQIFTAAHELAHWYIKYVFPEMAKHGYLKLPEFVDNPEWKWTEDRTKGCHKSEKVEQLSGKWRPVGDFIWNSLQQDSRTMYNETYDRCEPNSDGSYAKGCKKGSKIDPCKNHHYFIYTGQDNFLGLASGGAPKAAQRARGLKKNVNLFNLMKQIWPCNNTYLSVCEDFAHGFTKGLNQKLIIGKSNPADRSQMICHNDLDVSEIDEVQALSPVPEKDAEFQEKTKNGDETKISLVDGQGKCKRVLKLGTELGDPWVETTPNGKEITEIIYGNLQTSLGDSSERAWWLRKCCAITADAKTWA